MRKLPADPKELLENYKDPHRRNADHPADWEEVLPDYDELFDVLRQLHELSPDMRFGQLIANLAFLAGDDAGNDAYTVPDPHLLRAAREHLAKRRQDLNKPAPAEAIHR